MVNSILINNKQKKIYKTIPCFLFDSLEVREIYSYLGGNIYCK